MGYDPIADQNAEGDHSKEINEWRKACTQVYQTPFALKKQKYNRIAQNTKEETSTTILEKLDPWISTPAKKIESAILVSDMPHMTEMERRFLDTSQVVVDANGLAVPLEQYLQDQEGEYTVYELDLVLLTREPEVIKHALEPANHHSVKPTPSELAALNNLRSAYFSRHSK